MNDAQILEIALRKMSEHLNDLVAACTSPTGGVPKAPDMRALMAARGVLPPYCSMAFKKKGDS